MKKFLAILLVLCTVMMFAACGQNNDESTGNDDGVMSYAEYAAIEVVEGGDQVPVVVECYVQNHQSWWDNKITLYAQDKDGAYFMYEMACTEADAAKLTPGTKIRVTGYKTVWAGEYEIVDATFEFIKDADTYIAPVKDLTDKLGAEDLINYQNQFASFKGMTFESLSYKDSEWDPDIYVTLSYNGTKYDFCVENYLTGPDTDVYKAVSELKAGDVVDIEGFVYWYEGVNTHITGVTKK